MNEFTARRTQTLHSVVMFTISKHELAEIVAELRQMAATTSDVKVRAALTRLADRYASRAASGRGGLMRRPAWAHGVSQPGRHH